MMETPPDLDSNLADSTKRVIWRLLAVGHNRAELLMVEIQEERERVRVIIFMAAAMAILGLLAGITITALIVAAAGTHFLAALEILSVLYTSGAVILYLRIARLRKDWEPLSATRDQLQKDRECFEKTLS
jgi:uncharacterized membrane protein YqjE